MDRLPMDILCAIVVKLNGHDTKAISTTCKRMRLACERAHPWFLVCCSTLRAVQGLRSIKNAGEQQQLWHMRRCLALLADTMCELSRERLEREHGRNKRRRIEYNCEKSGHFESGCCACLAVICFRCAEGCIECGFCRRDICARCRDKVTTVCDYCGLTLCKPCGSRENWHQALQSKKPVCERCTKFRAGLIR